MAGEPLNVWITRAEPGAQATAERVRARGHNAVVAPLLVLRPVEGAGVDLRGVAALAFTSANGVRAFACADDRRDLPVYAVGDASAAQARALGFADVVSAAGDVHDLATLVTARLDPKAGPLLHPAASTVAGDLRGTLAAAGFEVLRVVLYDARPVTALSPQATQALAEGAVEAVALMSPRTAAAFARLITLAGLESACAAMVAVCLSDAVAQALGPLTWRRVAVAARPDQASLLAAIEAAAAQGA